MSTTRVAIYTAICGGYDDPLKISQPDPEVTYILFTDGSIDAAPHPWQLRSLPAIFTDPQRDARRVKALPHLFLPPEADISVWVDGNCRIKDMKADAILQLLGNALIALPAHAERKCVFKEAAALVASGLFDSPARIARQMSIYETAGLPHDIGLHHTNFLIRRHHDPGCVQFCMEWWQQMVAHSKRDQLSFDFVRWKLRHGHVKTLHMSYVDNHMFHCEGPHRMPLRIVSEHQGSPVRCKDLPHGFLAAPYDPQYDVWPPQFLVHLGRLNEIVSGTDEPLEGNLCYFHHQPNFKYAPPDPRRGARRETFLRALAGRSRVLEIGFNAGHSALLALTHSDATVTSVDVGSHAYTQPAATYLSNTFPDRLRFFQLDSRGMPALSQALGLGTHDMIHIDGGHAPDIFANDIATALCFSKPGTLVLIDDLYVSAIRKMTDFLVADRLLAAYGNLETVESGAYLTLETIPAAQVSAHSSIVHRLLSHVYVPRVSEETHTPFLSALLQGLDTASHPMAPRANSTFADLNSASRPILKLDGELIGEINRIGYHPFILARNAISPDHPRFLVCHTENRIDDFAKALMNVPVFSGSLLMRGIERALHQDIAAAADIFFSWCTMRTRRPERIYLGLPPLASSAHYYDYPIFEVAAGTNEEGAAPGIQQLAVLFGAYYHAKGNDRSRLALLEALAVALARWWGIHNEVDRAAEIMAWVVRINPTSMNLRAAINELDLRSRAALNSRTLRDANS